MRFSTISLAAAFAFLLTPSANSRQHVEKDTTLIPFVTLFHGMGQNMFGSFTYNYGANYIVGAVASYGLVEGGVDWQWRRNAIDHPWIPRTGDISVETGPIVSIGAPLGLYLYGTYERDAELQIVGLALGQAAINAGVITSVIKAFTGREGPQHKTTDHSEDFRFGFLRGGIYQGWPSTHTAIAFSMATTLMKLYPDNTLIGIGSMAYATIIGVGVSTNIHWLSDVVAGGLIGYAIGATTGASFSALLNRSNKDTPYSFSLTPAGLTFVYRF